MMRRKRAGDVVLPHRVAAGLGELPAGNRRIHGVRVGIGLRVRIVEVADERNTATAPIESLPVLASNEGHQPADVVAE